MSQNNPQNNLNEMMDDAINSLIEERTISNAPELNPYNLARTPEQQANLRAAQIAREERQNNIIDENKSQRQRLSEEHEKVRKAFEMSADLFLKQSPKDILHLTTGVQIDDLQQGQELVISFGGNPEIQRAVGLSMILPPQIRAVSVNGIKGERKGIGGNFFDSNGDYLQILENDKVKIETVFSEENKQKLYKERAINIQSYRQLLSNITNIDNEEKNVVIEKAVDTGIDPDLVISIRNAYNGEYGHDTSGNGIAQAKIAYKYLQTALHQYEKKNGDMSKDENGNYTSDFISYLLNHYTLFGVQMNKNQSEIEKVINIYRNRKNQTISSVINERETLNPSQIPSPSIGRRRRVLNSSAEITVPNSGRYNVNLEAIKGPDTTIGLEGKSLLDNIQFRNRLIQISNKLGCSPQDLIRVMEMESGLKPSIQNPTTRATGLIQFIPPTAVGLGTTIEELKNMSGLQQLDYVEKFYRSYFGKLRNHADLYLCTFYPLALNKPDNFVFGSEKSNPQFKFKLRDQNKGISNYSDRHDKLIDKKAFYKYTANHYRNNPNALYAKFDSLYGGSSI